MNAYLQQSESEVANDMEQVIRLQQYQEQALAMVTHDLKSPMNAILTTTQLLTQELDSKSPDKKDCLENIAMIEAAGNNVLELINSILTVARIEAGKETINPCWSDKLLAMLGNVLQTFRYQAETRNIELSLCCQPTLPEVYWDLSKIHYHVLNNLVSNALKFTQSGGEIKIATYADARNVFFKISDNGPGIPLAERKKIFDRFERIKVKTGRGYSSTGLGLYNSSLFVKQHGGTIEIAEGLHGKGVSFIVCLPIIPFQPLSGNN